VPWPTDDVWKLNDWRVVAGEASLHHGGAGVNNDDTSIISAAAATVATDVGARHNSDTRTCNVCLVRRHLFRYRHRYRRRRRRRRRRNRLIHACMRQQRHESGEGHATRHNAADVLVVFVNPVFRARSRSYCRRRRRFCMCGGVAS
jgi:hypothetical protein